MSKDQHALSEPVEGRASRNVTGTLTVRALATVLDSRLRGE